MIRPLMNLLANRFWLKKNSLLAIATIAIPLFGAEPELKKTKSDYKAESVPLEKTRFGRWIERNKALLKKKNVYLSERLEIRDRAYKFDDPRKLSTAGMLFIIYRMPHELQRYIMQYLAADISPATIGIDEHDLAIDPKRDYLHNHAPHIKHTPYGSTVVCASRKCSPRRISLDYGLFKNSTIDSTPTLIDYLWRLMQAKAKKANMPAATMLVFNRHDQTIFTGHERDATIPAGQASMPTHYWNILQDSRMKQKLANPATHDFDLPDMLALLDAENSLDRKKRESELTDKSIAAFNDLKRKISEIETENNIPIEPLFVDRQLISKTDQSRRILRHESAFVNDDPQE